MARLLFLLLSLSTIAHAVPLTCMDMNNNNVDWFIFYKLPRISKSPNAHIANGTGFLYMDSNSRDHWTLPTQGMEGSDHAIFYTLQHYYQNSKDTTFSIMYNDEFPDSEIISNCMAHSKGVSVFDQNTGYWLIHSIPKFPSNVTWSYPSNAHTYAQMGICVSYQTQQLTYISQQLFFNQPFIYEIAMPDFAKSFPFLVKIQQGLFNSFAPYTSNLTLTSIGGQQFTSFAKSGQWGKDLYYDFVAPTLKTDLEVETWQHSAALNLNATCASDNSTTVLDMTNVTLPYNITFKTTNDHSKYAIGFNRNPRQLSLPWICVGDINRQTHQMVRGGGTLCLDDPTVHDVYTAMIASTDACTVPSPPPNPASDQQAKCS